jgi:integrase
MGSVYWRFKYKFAGKEKLLALGQYPAVKLAVARKGHQDAKIMLQSGIDPSAARQVERAEQQAAEVEAARRDKTFGEIADEWLETRVPAKHKDIDQTLLRRFSKTYARDARMVGYLKNGKAKVDGFGSIAIDNVELSHLTPLLKTVNHPSRIRLISAARKIIAYAKAHGLWPKDRPSPFADIDFAEGFAKHKEQHRPAITDPAKLGHLLRKIAVYEGGRDNLTGFALELLALTFVRLSTVATAKWEHIDLNSRRKGRPKKVTLSSGRVPSDAVPGRVTRQRFVLVGTKILKGVSDVPALVLTHHQPLNVALARAGVMIGHPIPKHVLVACAFNALISDAM